MKPREPGSLPVPGSRLSRLMRFGSLASGVAGGMLAEGARQWVQGKRPALSELLLTSGNVHRVVEQLSQLRGAAMKVGQLTWPDAYFTGSVFGQRQQCTRTLIYLLP
ncbi:hypothetical protein [Pseudomonas sp. SG20052]|uniref:hypothetical protein n=1 Tax=Pseudomonas sp. SG20052 TaxID=3074147 RepID=UPI00287F88C1|nr:hypothetical protein [Pseudomonas sp. SG20052]WNF58528.1 hypothetical protein RHP74_14940 [Pseudomonas sp. SG20052]